MSTREELKAEIQASLKKEQITLILDGVETVALATSISTMLQAPIPEDAKEALRAVYKRLQHALEKTPVWGDSRI